MPADASESNKHARPRTVPTKMNGDTAPIEHPEEQREQCGLVMPISSLEGLSEQHWLEVKDVLTDAITTAGFSARLVSAADDVGIIQKRIIQNLYENPVVVCDVSGKNPNVMFELGMRLAFDKPTIIVKDDKTSYSFDTGVIEHLEYPRDLRFQKIVAFKDALAEKISATHKKSRDDKNYTTFLKHFGRFEVASLDVKTVSKEDFIIEQIKELKSLVFQIDERSRLYRSSPLTPPPSSRRMIVRDLTRSHFNALKSYQNVDALADEVIESLLDLGIIEPTESTWEYRRLITEEIEKLNKSRARRIDPTEKAS